MTAFKATFSDMKLVKTRQVVQLIFEVPIEDFDAAYEVLGGMPIPSKERWFAFAAIKPPAEKETKPVSPATPQPDTLDRPLLVEARQTWNDFPPAKQAGIRSHDPRFSIFLEEEFPNLWRELQDAAQCIRDICGVKSRSELNGPDNRNRVLWHQLDQRYDTWLLRERVGA
jgi:hypothetical protein